MARYRGSTAERGLGGAHQADRKRLLALHKDGDPCWRCGQPMYKWQELDRDHVVDRVFGGTGGPAVLAHATCNRTAGARLSNQVRPQRTSGPADGRDTVCKTCGKRYWYAARGCEICGVHYHPHYSKQRSCSRACGVEVRRRRGTLKGRPSPPYVLGSIGPVCRVYIRSCEHCGVLFVGQQKTSKYCSRQCGDTAYNRQRYGVRQWHCACGIEIPAGRKKCDECREIRQDHKRECRHEDCHRRANRAGGLCSRHSRLSLILRWQQEAGEVSAGQHVA